jgi:hypothetical protein
VVVSNLLRFLTGSWSSPVSSSCRNSGIPRRSPVGPLILECLLTELRSPEFEGRNAYGVYMHSSIALGFV